MSRRLVLQLRFFFDCDTWCPGAAGRFDGADVCVLEVSRNVEVQVCLPIRCLEPWYQCQTQPLLCSHGRYGVPRKSSSLCIQWIFLPTLLAKLAPKSLPLDRSIYVRFSIFYTYIRHWSLIANGRYLPLGGKRFQFLSIIIIFVFVGFWHDTRCLVGCEDMKPRQFCFTIFLQLELDLLGCHQHVVPTDRKWCNGVVETA